MEYEKAILSAKLVDGQKINAMGNLVATKTWKVTYLTKTPDEEIERINKYIGGN